MRYAGIDVASQTHVVAVVDEGEQVLVRPTPFAEDAAGYALLFERLGPAQDVIVAMEATGHYWRNLAVDLLARGFPVALINPLRTHRFAGEDLRRTKTDAIDALGVARFARQKRPAPMCNRARAVAAPAPRRRLASCDTQIVQCKRWPSIS